MAEWNHLDSEALYNVSRWGADFFRVNERGHVEVTPDGAGSTASVDLHDLIGEIRLRGVATPILLRFDGVLRTRVRQIGEAFDNARQEFEYEAPYRTVYPIKVNQDRHVVEALLEEGRGRQMGLEVGSKPELLAVMTLQGRENPLVVCNGYKDDEYVEMALLARKVGANTIIVIEKHSEFELILRKAREVGIEPVLGVRAKLGHRGSGRWRDSGGDRSKFGLTTRQIVSLVEELREEGKLSWLQLLHFHIGSQVTNIRSLKGALREAVHTFVGLHEMGASISFLDVGGGLGVDYDGSRTDFESSVNYSVQEYANDVVFHVAEACREAEIGHPTLLTESGRALVAHHAVLVTDVLGVSNFTSVGVPAPPDEDEHEIVHEIAEDCEDVNGRNFQEVFHDVREVRDRAMMMFNVGQLSLPTRARVEEFYWRTYEKILRITQRLDYVPDDLADLERDLADTYFVNFSIFQSMPDAWAIKQLFPILPMQRLGERPVRPAILADLTCDSDGRIDRFIDLRDVKSTLPLHPLTEGEPYYLGFFLVGAYQEILGDMHNLFGDTNIVHVDVDAQGKPRLKHVVRGDRVKDVLLYVDFDEKELVRAMRALVEEALDDERITFEESATIMRRYEQALRGYTYLSRESAPALVAPALETRS